MRRPRLHAFTLRPGVELMMGMSLWASLAVFWLLIAAIIIFGISGWWLIAAGTLDIVPLWWAWHHRDRGTGAA